MNNYLKSSFLLLGLACSFSAEVLAQGTVDDYNRAYSLRQKYSARNVLYSDVVPHWINKSDAFWYIRNTEKGKEYVKVDLLTQSVFLCLIMRSCRRHFLSYQERK